MKAKELMIGDWVQIKGYLDYDKVQEIAMDENAKWYISFACSATLFRAYEFEPISITEEILKENGWERLQGTDDSWKYRPTLYLFKQDNGYRLREGESYCIDHICYIHELQHALRLCGLNELADNFKVE